MTSPEGGPKDAQRHQPGRHYAAEPALEASYLQHSKQPRLSKSLCSGLLLAANGISNHCAWHTPNFHLRGSGARTLQSTRQPLSELHVMLTRGPLTPSSRDVATCYDAPDTQHSHFKGDSSPELREQMSHEAGPEMPPSCFSLGQLDMGFARECQRGIATEMVSDSSKSCQGLLGDDN